MDKERAVIDFLLGCDQIRDNPLFFNFLNAKDNNKQFMTVANDKVVNRSFIDGSVLKRFTFTIIDYRTVAYQAVVKQPGYPNENLEEYLDIQSMLDWVDEQADNHNYPNFGTDCVVEDMRTLTDQPSLNGVDSNTSPALAKYSISIQIDYLDISKRIWN